MRKESDLLYVYVRGDVMKGVLTFRMFIRILSYPWEVSDFSHLMIFLFLRVLYIYFQMWTGEFEAFMKRVCVCVCGIDTILCLSVLMLLVIMSATVKK
jgi:hypothetical protein